MSTKSRIIIAALLIGAAAFAYLRWTGGSLLQSAPQPAGGATAEVRLQPIAAATDADTLVVQVRGGWLRPPAIVFQAADYGGSASLEWHGPRQLTVCLKRAENLKVYRAYRTWKNVTISYRDHACDASR